MDKTAIHDFLHAQVAAWNAGDRDAFFAAYRKAAPEGLRIEYVGRPETDGWPVLEGMWAQQSARIQVEEVVEIINGREAALHNLNKLRGTSTVINTIELYRFDGGVLTVRYFVLQP